MNLNISLGLASRCLFLSFSRYPDIFFNIEFESTCGLVVWHVAQTLVCAHLLHMKISLCVVLSGVANYLLYYILVRV